MTGRRCRSGLQLRADALMRGARATDARAMALYGIDDGEQCVETEHVEAVDAGDGKGVLGQQLGQIFEEVRSRFVAVVVEV